MVFSVSRSRPFRSLGLYKSTGRHAARKRWVPQQRHAGETVTIARRPAHAASMPRLTGPHADAEHRAA
jgi:hypothetical protein